MPRGAYASQRVERQFLLDPMLTPDIVARLVDYLDRMVEREGRELVSPYLITVQADTVEADDA